MIASPGTTADTSVLPCSPSSPPSKMVSSLEKIKTHEEYHIRDPAIEPSAVGLDEKGEYGGEAKIHVAQTEEDVVEFDEKKELKRGLSQRHIQMIALAGTIGTGLFLGSGAAIAQAGPVGACLGYLLVGILVAGVVLSIAEMSALVPLSGGIVRHANYFFDPALSFAQGWNTIYGTAVGLPAEITAAAVLIDFWTTSVNNAVWITILGLLLFISNLLLVRVYGEMEFCFAILKMSLVVGLIIMGLCIDLGGTPNHDRIGFRYWKNPGPFVQYLGIPGSLGQFLGFWTVFNNAAYAYSGVESISVAAAETKSPRRNIPKAAKRIFWRVLFFYVFAIFIVSLIVPSDDPDLLKGSGTATQSPFVIAANIAGINVIPHIINAIVLTSAWSAGNSGMLGGSRALYGLAREGHAPKVFLRTNRFGIPYVAVCTIGMFLCLGYLSVGSAGAATAFSWFQDLVGSAALVLWIVMCTVYLRFYAGCKAQGIDRNELPWKAPFQPYAAWISAISFSIILLTGGFSVFINGDWTAQGFVGAYFNIPLIFVLYFGYKFARKTKMVPLMEMPIKHFLQIAKENPEVPEVPLRGWKRLGFLWS